MRTWLLSLSFVLMLSGPSRALAQAAPAQQAPPVKNPQSEAKLQSFTGPDGHFSIQIPGQPVYAAQPVQLKNSTAQVQLNQFYVEIDDNHISYMLMYTDYPPEAGNGAPATLLQNVLKASVADKTLVTSGNINLGTVPGISFVAKDKDNYQYDVHDYFINKRLYQLVIVTAQGYTATFRDAFFNSFQIK